MEIAITRCASKFGYLTVMDLVRRPAAIPLISAFCRCDIAKLFVIIALYYALPWSLILSIIPSSLYMVVNPTLLLNTLANCFTLENTSKILSQLMYLALYLCWTVALQSSC